MRMCVSLCVHVPARFARLHALIHYSLSLLESINAPLACKDMHNANAFAWLYIYKK